MPEYEWQLFIIRQLFILRQLNYTGEKVRLIDHTLKTVLVSKAALVKKYKNAC